MRPEQASAFLEFAVPHAVAWVEEQRYRYGSHRDAALLSPEVRAVFKPFFPAAVLERTKFVTIGRWLDRPQFFDELVRRFDLTEDQLAPFLQPMGITYENVIVLTTMLPHPTKLPNLALCFHELVHVVQYEKLGADAFMRRYVEGWLGAGGHYEGIPLEVMARALEMRFAQAPRVVFDVEREVMQQIERARYGAVLPRIEEQHP